MRKLISLLVLSLSLTACASTSGPRMDPAMANRINTSNAEYLASQGIVPPTEAEKALQRVKLAREKEHRDQLGYESATVAPPSVSGWDVMRGLIALPIVIPLAAMVEYGHGPYSTSVHCRSFTYKDQYHATCY